MTEQSRTEYRVVGESPPPGGSFQSDRFRSPRAAHSRVHIERRFGSTNVRIQSRIVTETPWTDLQDVSDDD